MGDVQSEKFSSSGNKIARALLMIFILQFVAFSCTKAQLDSLDNIKKYSIYIVEDEPAPIQPSYSHFPFSLRETLQPPGKSCPANHKKDRNGKCREVQKFDDD